MSCVIVYQLFNPIQQDWKSRLPNQHLIDIKNSFHILSLTHLIVNSVKCLFSIPLTNSGVIPYIHNTLLTKKSNLVPPKQQ